MSQGMLAEFGTTRFNSTTVAEGRTTFAWVWEKRDCGTFWNNRIAQNVDCAQTRAYVSQSSRNYMRDLQKVKENTYYEKSYEWISKLFCIQLFL